MKSLSSFGGLVHNLRRRFVQELATKSVLKQHPKGLITHSLWSRKHVLDAEARIVGGEDAASGATSLKTAHPISNTTKRNGPAWLLLS